jgi:hypothetical protein
MISETYHYWEKLSKRVDNSKYLKIRIIISDETPEGCEKDEERCANVIFSYDSHSESYY